MDWRRLLPVAFGGLVGLVACGSDDARSASSSTSSGGSKPGSSSGSSSGDTTSSGSSGDPAQGDDPLVGLWTVSGTDDRGTYTGDIEIRNANTPANGTDYTFIRTIHYPDVKVEDGRELHWLFRGTLKKTSDKLALSSTLKRADFIVQRGSVTRTANDGPVAISGDLTLDNGTVTGTITGTIPQRGGPRSPNGGISLNDTWKTKTALPATPIFTDERHLVPAHAPPSTATKTALFAAYSSFQGLDVVKPYTSRPEFQDAVHRHILDTTDLDFYRANKNALRVVDKPIDDVSLGETLARADAYRYTLTEKAALYDADIEQRFLDPAVGMIPSGGPPGTALGDWSWSGDGSLWTAVYLASQVYRFEVTSEPKAKANVITTLDALLKLQEITGDWTQFARTLRKAGATPPSPPWHAGTGQYAGLEWLEGGNNDMLKGLLYGYLMGWELLCEGGKTGNESLCARIRTNAKHLADDVSLGGSNSPAAQLTNQLPTSWLYATVTTDLADSLVYKLKAQGYWSVGKPIQKQTPVIYEQGTVDWSGQHLSSIGDLVAYNLAKRIDLNGDALSGFVAEIDASHKNLEKQRFANWHILKAAFGTGAGPSSPFIQDAKSRMNEARYPKTSFNLDHRISSTFCMAPYPALPWKNDWTTNDRSEGLDSHPLFEMHPDIMYWKTGQGYLGFEGFEAPGGDFLHLYWFARKYGLFTAKD